MCCQFSRDFGHPANLCLRYFREVIRNILRSARVQYKPGKQLVHSKFADTLHHLNIEAGVELLLKLAFAPTDSGHVATQFISWNPLWVEPSCRMHQQLAWRRKKLVNAAKAARGLWSQQCQRRCISTASFLFPDQHRAHRDKLNRQARRNFGKSPSIAACKRWIRSALDKFKGIPAGQGLYKQGQPSSIPAVKQCSDDDVTRHPSSRQPGLDHAF